jgi:hypothetical protein
MQGINSLLNPSSQIPLQDLQNQQNPSQIQNSHFDPNSSSNDDFLEQMLSNIPPCSWPDLKSPWDLTMPINNNDSSNSIAKPRDLSDETAPSNTDNSNLGFHNNFDESVILASKLRQHQISGGSGAAAAAKMMLQQQLLMAAARGGLSQNDDIDVSPTQVIFIFTIIYSVCGCCYESEQFL